MIFKQIYLTNRTLTDTTTQSQSGPGSNGYEDVLHFTYKFKIGA